MTKRTGRARRKPTKGQNPEEGRRNGPRKPWEPSEIYPRRGRRVQWSPQELGERRKPVRIRAGRRPMGEVIRRPEAPGRAAAGGKTSPRAGEASEIYQGNGSGREVFKKSLII